MVTRDTILDVLRTIDDPEMPISIVDLGIVEDVRIAEADADPAEQVEIDILPTFIGCPALPMIEQNITQKVGLLDGVESVRVRFVFDQPLDRFRQSAGLTGHQEAVNPVFDDFSNPG